MERRRVQLGWHSAFLEYNKDVADRSTENYVTSEEYVNV